MRATIKNKKYNLTLIQGEKNYRGKPINEKLVLLESRLLEVDDVICLALADNPQTHIVEFMLLLPEKGAFKEREITMRSNKLFQQFISYLEPDIGSETPIDDGYIPNHLRYVSRRVYMKERMPYYAYKIGLLINHEIFEDISACGKFNECLMDKIIRSWKLATKLNYEQIESTFLMQSISGSVVNNFNDDSYKEYLDVHQQLSAYAVAGYGSNLRAEGGFNCSID